jgi:hypothetical protein
MTSRMLLNNEVIDQYKKISLDNDLVAAIKNSSHDISTSFPRWKGRGTLSISIMLMVFVIIILMHVIRRLQGLA